ncbi:MAG: sigma-70 family RNA polymerase sigma factor [Erysipelotrichaceae bacterium]|nr:sigma-70 family RNA polymerase sigma factor [Erysipelotrichaceae bacterium]
MEEKEAIRRIQAGEDEAFTVILEKYRPLIYSFLRSLPEAAGAYIVDRDDLIQEGIIALHEACCTYREERGTVFSTFAYLVIRRKMHRVFYRENSRYLKEYYSLDQYAEADHLSLLTASRVGEDPVGAYNARQKQQELSEMLSRLSREDSRILEMRSRSCSYSEIAAELGTTAKRVDNRLQRLKRRFRERKGTEGSI